ncbi:MAG: hypothetical protein ACHQ06_05680 [Candidatus Dormibacteria bacterium]
MLRHLARLARRVPSMGPRAIAIAVYADVGHTPVAAQQAGFEGVACVDDAARALELYCRLYDATRLPWVHHWCAGLLDFLLGMQDDDGRWVNFILEWDGARNLEGRTSVAGGLFWQARASLALARARQSFDDDRIAAALVRGLPHLDGDAVPPDVRVLHILTALRLRDCVEHPRPGQLLSGWLDEVASCRIDGVLMNAPEERGRPHLWGHLQEGVLAEAGTLIGRDDLVDVARVSAELVFRDVVESGFAMERVLPYDVASCVDGLSRMALAIRDPEYDDLAQLARAWFDGRNPAGRPVYDRDAGRVGDGVDQGRVSAGSGAESNIVAAQALFDDTVTLALALAGSPPIPAG